MALTYDTSDTRRLIIEPDGVERQYWRDLWRYRELFFVLARRDISVRYKQTVLGVAWAVVRPVLTMIIFTVVFGKIAQLPSGVAAPYPLMVFVGMLPWTFFSSAVVDASNSVVQNAALVSKIYFPRLIIPFSSVVAAFIDFLIGILVLSTLMIGYRSVPDWHIIFLPFFFILAFALSLGIGMYFAALNVKYRDFRHVLPFAVQLGLYVSPVGFSSLIVPETWRILYALNPMVAVIDGFRWCLLPGAPMPEPSTLLIGVGAAVILLLVGVRRFRRTEREFADQI
jgi:lipopolysaccharide transport system permease protein